MIKEILTYINYHLEEKLSLSKLSELSGYSSHHLHRMLKEELGEPIGNYIKKTRMEKAAYLISLTNTPIQDIKHLVGYDNDSSFARAFKDVYSLTPTEFRNNNQLKKMLKGTEEHYLSLKCEKVILKEQKAIVFPNYGNYFSKEIYTIWNEAKRFLNDQQASESDFEYYGILHNCQNLDEKANLRFDAALVPKNPKSINFDKFFSQTIPTGKFARYKFCSKVSEYKQNGIVITKHLTEASGYTHREDMAYFKYQQLPDPNHLDNLLIDWFLPIK